MDGAAAKQAIREQAIGLGFDAVGFTSPVPEPADAVNLAQFLALGRAGDMGWMDNPRRGDALKTMATARTVVVLGANYGPAVAPLAAHRHRDRGAISVYAQGSDYHDVLKKRLKRLGRWMADTLGGEIKVFVDTAPVMEKPLAARAGVGWQGKHTNLVSREFGSWLFLAEVFTSLDLPPDTAQSDLCGTCDACQRACPTDALAEPYRIDPRRCVSYLTIEHKDNIAPELMAGMGNRIYGCDDCLAVCPWNKFATPGREEKFLPRAELTTPRLKDLAQLDDAAFRRVFAGSPIKRTGRDRFVRNVLVAIGNSGDWALKAIAEELIADDSPVVAEAAQWAVGRLDESHPCG